jgi:glycosyltransferase involved in cell wall biosynthesis
MNILIFFPYNLRTVEQQSVMEMLIKEGHNVFLLTTCTRGYLHEYVENLGVKTHAAPQETSSGKLQFYRRNLKKLASVITENNIEVVIAHQQIPALLAGILKSVKRFKLIFVRHNSDEDYQLTPLKAKWLNKIANLLTPIKVAPSSIVEQFWMEREKVAKSQIYRINYGYNFNQYEKPDRSKAEKIMIEFPSALRVLSIARLAPTKRHVLMFEIISRLINEGIDCKLLCLGSGPDEKLLERKIIELNMQSHIFLAGRKENIFDYIEAADVFLHLSSSEASNSAVKEVGLLQKPVIVCKGVGDFEDYIVNGENGFLVNKQDPVNEAYTILRSIAENAIDKKKIGEQLRKTVLEKFHIDNIAKEYGRVLERAFKT